jgi:undecaprenyl-diphosphatase
MSVLAAVVAGVTALLSTAFLMRYFRQQDAWALNPFAYYCLVAGAVSLGVLFLL